MPLSNDEDNPGALYPQVLLLTLSSAQEAPMALALSFSALQFRTELLHFKN